MEPMTKTAIHIKILQAPIRAYRFIFSPFVGHQCRFHPTCSAYMLEALEKHGALKGLFLGTRRLLCCHPWGTCRKWDDPVPKTFAWREMPGYKNGKHETKNSKQA